MCMTAAAQNLLSLKLAASLGVSRQDAATRVHKNPRLALEVESASVRSKYSVAFDQTHVKANKVVRWEKGDEREEYYRASDATFLRAPTET